MPTIPNLFPPDYSTVVGQIRLLIPDTDQLDNLQDLTVAADYIFDDEQLQALASVYGNNIKRAAAQAKLILATSEALINKVIKTADYATDGAKLGAELREQSKALFAEADKDDQFDSSETFLVVPQGSRWENDWL